MAIAYANKLAESSSASTTVNVTTGAEVKAGSLIVVAFGARSGSALTASSVKIGSTSFTLHQRQDAAPNVVSPQVIGIAYYRTPTAVAASTTIATVWSQTPTMSWISAHAFEGAAGTHHDTGSAQTSNGNWYAEVDVTGSDWLSVGVIALPFEYGTITRTVSASSVERDHNAASSAAARPWMAMVSRNGSSGATHTPGFTGASVTCQAVSLSFGYEAMPTGGGGSINSGLWAV